MAAQKSLSHDTRYMEHHNGLWSITFIHNASVIQQ